MKTEKVEYEIIVSGGCGRSAESVEMSAKIAAACFGLAVLLVAVVGIVELIK